MSGRSGAAGIARDLLRLARLRRQRNAIVEQAGEEIYGHIESNQPHPTRPETAKASNPVIRDGLALSWSGGKDSSLTLWRLRGEGLEPRALITTSSESFDRVSHHGVRRSLLACQAEELGIELVEVMLPSPCSMEDYERRFERAFSETILAEIQTVAFGDIFLEELRVYRERKLESAGRTALFPLWKQDTTELACQFIDAGFEAALACVDPRKLDPSFAGRRFDQELLADLPPDVDPCGENGEFHTFVHAGPIFANRIPCLTGVVVERDGMIFCDLIPAPAPIPAPSA